MSKVTYQSPRNTVFYHLERGGLFRLADIAEKCLMTVETAERALDANVRLGRLVKDVDFYTVADEHRVPLTLNTWYLLAERLMARLPKGDRLNRCLSIYNYDTQA